MRSIGLIGGMSWESTILYYKIVNTVVRNRLGGLHSARCILWSFDFDEIVRLQREGDWQRATERMIDAAAALERAGADVAVICTNTMHKMFDAVSAAIGIPMIHIADPTAERIKSAGLSKIGLLATRFTMEDDFYVGRLIGRHGLNVLTPPATDRAVVHEIIFDELCRGIVRDESRTRLQSMIARMAEDGAEGIILGCTELCLLLGQEHSPLPIFDTTVIHAETAAEWALRTEPAPAMPG
ncbi:MAG TPA: aspartate/glutamate racemase family protein [Phycisphaerae bacterium]|nr:aspartate/glutamate racemase family protein [Phycisphaerae bacterium]HOJ75712.1 aspartate/glutamate racemase family protein [Phycisphaerae bacterium]HOM53147.1 aspartate/glutamate racemase family protein [Phycisphaerae bacterium]HON67839.1 aspartate/glutamate racemase family protein [Phycisphaerae bacterium]HOQ87323.1 aspartate/glutamate racemase family protein [Phycisphaerae bacterium]